MPYKIEHDFAKVVYFPVSAMPENIAFLMDKRPNKLVETRDGVICDVVEFKEINILSDKGQELCRMIYKTTFDIILKSWHRKIGDRLNTLFFFYLKLEKAKK